MDDFTIPLCQAICQIRLYTHTHQKKLKLYLIFLFPQIVFHQLCFHIMTTDLTKRHYKKEMKSSLAFAPGRHFPMAFSAPTERPHEFTNTLCFPVENCFSYSPILLIFCNCFNWILRRPEKKNQIYSLTLLCSHVRSVHLYSFSSFLSSMIYTFFSGSSIFYFI